MKFDLSISLGSMIHLVFMLFTLFYIYFGMSKRLNRIEDKQDKLIANIVQTFPISVSKETISGRPDN